MQGTVIPFLKVLCCMGGKIDIISCFVFSRYIIFFPIDARCILCIDTSLYLKAITTYKFGTKGIPYGQIKDFTKGVSRKSELTYGLDFTKDYIFGVLLNLNGNLSS